MPCNSPVGTKKNILFGCAGFGGLSLSLNKTITRFKVHKFIIIIFLEALNKAVRL